MADSGSRRRIQPDSGEQSFPVYSKRSTARANRAAHLYYADGKSFREAMLEAGYSETVAKQGPKFMLRHSVGLRDAFEEASKLHLRPEQLKALAVYRLFQEIVNPKSRCGIKAIEVLGKMKECDWFVHGSDLQVGVFAAISDPGIDWKEEAKRLQTYRDTTAEDKQSE